MINEQGCDGGSRDATRDLVSGQGDGGEEPGVLERHSQDHVVALPVHDHLRPLRSGHGANHTMIYQTMP